MVNFIDKTFSVIADLILKILPIGKREKTAFSYYRDGMAAQERGRYGEAVTNYYESLKFEQDPLDRSRTLFNIGVLYTNSGRYLPALNYYAKALELNPDGAEIYYNIGVIFHSQALRAALFDDEEHRKFEIDFFDKAAYYWIQAVKLAPDSYPGARNWLKITNRYNDEEFQ